MVRKPIARRELATALEAAGIPSGTVLVVHSALGRIGWMLGGPQAAVRALQDVLGPRGTLVMPTFSFSLAAWNLPPFDPGRTPSRVGLLTDTFWRMEGVLRSSHPTHSFAAGGPLAPDIVGGPIDYEPLGIGSPVDRVRQAGGHILLIGVGQDRNSTVHLAEDLAGMPYLRVPFDGSRGYDEAWYAKHPGGEAHRLEIHRMPGSSEGFEVLDHILLRQGIVTEHPVGQTTARFMESEALCNAIVPMLAENPLLLLSASSGSEITARRRRHMESLAAKGSPNP